MHVILSAFGSYGDVLPMAGLGATLRGRGHRVQIIVNPYFQAVVEGAGLELLPLGTAEEYRSLMHHPDLWHPRRGLKLVLTRGAAAFLRDAYKLIEAHYRADETVLAAHGLDLASRIYNERFGAPLATVHFAPFAFKTLYDMPRYIGVPSTKYWPRWLKAALFWAADRWMVDPIMAPPVNGLRGELGLAPTAHIYSQWNNSPQLVLGLFPDWFAPLQPDWPECTALAGFPLWNPLGAREHGMTEEAEAFLDAGEPPIVFAPGSANVQGAEFFSTAAAACEQLGRRGMLVTKYPDQVSPRLPAGVQRFGFVPFSLLLPKAAALVHHGGIGTCAQGLASGIPQLVMPMAYDQLDNGQRLQRLGVGAVVPRPKFKPRRVAAELARLLATGPRQARCAELASRCDGAASLDAACDLIEQLHAHRRRPADSCLPQPSHLSKY